MGPVRPSGRRPTKGRPAHREEQNRLNDQDLLRLHAARRRSFLFARPPRGLAQRGCAKGVGSCPGSTSLRTTAGSNGPRPPLPRPAHQLSPTARRQPRRRARNVPDLRRWKMKAPSKILIAYDGSACSDAALGDLRRAGLPASLDALVLTVADVIVPPPDKELPGEPAVRIPEVE